MFIFNSTFLVSDKVHGAWIEWIKEEYIFSSMKSGIFTHPQVAKIHTEDEQEGTSFSVQFHVSDKVALDLWRAQNEEKIQRKCFEKFGTEVLSFSTVLEILL